jgi:hypothetical protein
MDDPRVDSFFELVLKAATQMELRNVDEAFSILDGIAGANLTGWPLEVWKGCEHLRHAKDLADRAQALQHDGKLEEAERLWRSAEDACEAARTTCGARMISLIGSMPVALEDGWPDLVREFHEYLDERRRQDDDES